MKMYLAGERQATDLGTRNTLIAGASSVWTKNVKRRLFSFYYHGFAGHRIIQGKMGLSIDVEEAIERGWDLFLDSGAFTAFTKGAEIPLREYAIYLRKNQQHYHALSSMDAIGGTEEKNYDNFTKLRSVGCNVRPVYHVRENPRWLQRYIDEGHDYVFVGGMVPETTGWLMERLDGLWERYLTNPDGTPRVKIHGFGLTDQKLMFRYPWYSIDSTSWLMTGIFGACLFRVGDRLRKVVFSHESPEARKYKGWHYTNLPAEGKRQVDAWLEPYGVTAEQLASHYSYRDVVNAAVFQGLEDLGATRFEVRQRTLFA